MYDYEEEMQRCYDRCIVKSKLKTISKNIALKFMIDTKRMYLYDYKGLDDGKTPIETNEKLKPLELLLREELGFSAYYSKNYKLRERLLGNANLYYNTGLRSYEFESGSGYISDNIKQLIEETFAVVDYEYLKIGQMFKYIGPCEFTRYFPNWDHELRTGKVIVMDHSFIHEPDSCYETHCK